MTMRAEDAARDAAARLRSKPIIRSILERLARDLDPRFVFHNAEHAEDVLREAVMFAAIDNRSERELELLAIAAAFHDAGHLESSDDHEARGAEMAAQAMRQEGGYTEEEVALVEAMIRDTRLTDNGFELQRASVPLAAYLLDADLSNLGRDDFFTRLELLCKEQGREPNPSYLAATLGMMQQHRWLTAAAERKRQQKKEENLQKLTALLSS